MKIFFFFFPRALYIRERKLGLNHPDVARTLNLAGKIQFFLGNIEKAKETLENSRKILENKLGPEHMKVAAVLADLAKVEEALGNFREAENLHLEALQIRKNCFGENHPEVADR